MKIIKQPEKQEIISNGQKTSDSEEKTSDLPASTICIFVLCNTYQLIKDFKKKNFCLYEFRLVYNQSYKKFNA